MTWPVRAGYWFIVVFFTIILSYGVRSITALIVNEDKPGRYDAVAILLMMVGLSPIVWMFTHYADIHPASKVPSLIVFAAYTFLLSAAIFVGRRFVPGFERVSYGFLPSAEETEAPPRLLRRLSPDIQAPILRISASDHFVEVATAKGTEKLRLRFIDAINEMEPVEGYCVHRSHWVTREAITRVDRENAQKLFVVLKNGERLPVSRKYSSNLEEAGLLD